MNKSNYNEYDEFTKRIGFTSMMELICICLFPLILQCLRSLVCIHFNILSKNRFYLSLIIDYFIILVPIILLLTLLSSYIIIIVISCFVLFLLWSLLPNYNQMNSFGNFHFLPTDILIAYLRTTIYILSCIMIYAIDLPICPRRFAKSELNGLGLMDVGTGLFICASSISGSKLVFYMNIYRDNSSKRFFDCTLNSVVPCLLLGLLRTLFIQMSNYHQNIVEYGVHWNFFYTIGLIRAISLFNPRTLHYINDNRSKSLWIANFEGVTSLFGYASIYFFNLISSLNKKEFPRNTSLFRLHLICAFMILCSISCGSQMTSRRFGNSNYVLLIIFLSVICFIFLTSMISLLIHFKSLFNLNLSYSPLSLIINDKGLLYFIISNLLTGFFNHRRPTTILQPTLSWAFFSSSIQFLFIFLMSISISWRNVFFGLSLLLWP
ncbi:unnamed protein product [Schistosoma margrebowiei]|uniref:Phosphatidylinositol-glycan biosynthesis class W protein n=1 Tax=Schistosoma margrebowiei TaxID=48269 RepID=A0A183N1Q4_9TREM|nr:unnamed protein product [Schistosoma margrebowiei]